MSVAETICVASGLGYRYGDHLALDGVDLQTQAGEIVAMLGPNGSGKTTLFRLLCTLMPLQTGEIQIGGFSVRENPLAIRSQIGIVFQSPSLDKKLTVDENIACQAALYGITGAELKQRRDQLLEQLDLVDRRNDFCEQLSGGLKRRVELAKGMLHQPRLLLLDEPSTGLDPAARLQLWNALTAMAGQGTSILMTTHLLEEADKADRVMILADGKKIAEGSPARLRSEFGDGVITVESSQPDHVATVIREKLSVGVTRADQQLRLAVNRPADFVPVLAACLQEAGLSDSVQSIAVGRPGLEDVFIEKTGQRFL